MGLEEPLEPRHSKARLKFRRPYFPGTAPLSISDACSWDPRLAPSFTARPRLAGGGGDTCGMDHVADLPRKAPASAWPPAAGATGAGMASPSPSAALATHPAPHKGRPKLPSLVKLLARRAPPRTWRHMAWSTLDGIKAQPNDRLQCKLCRNQHQETSAAIVGAVVIPILRPGIWADISSRTCQPYIHMDPYGIILGSTASLAKRPF